MIATGDNLAVAELATPIRTCVGCRATRAQQTMVRFMRRDDGHIVPATITRDLRGRTAYVCPRRACLDQALKRRAFTRAFGSGRRHVSVIDVDADALWTATIEQLRREIDLLGRTSDRDSRNPHAHPRRRGLEQLLSELSSLPPPHSPLERSSSKRGPSQPQIPQPRSNGAANDGPKGGAPSHG